MNEEIEGFFTLLDLVNSDSGELSTKAASVGITTLSEWEERVHEKLQWIGQNRSEVLMNLHPLRKKWPKSCIALEEMLTL